MLLIWFWLLKQSVTIFFTKIEQEIETSTSASIDSRIFELVECARLIANYLEVPTSRYDVGSMYEVSMRRTRDESTRDKESESDKNDDIMIQGDLDWHHLPAATINGFIMEEEIWVSAF